MSWTTLTQSHFNQLLYECAYSYVPLGVYHTGTLRLYHRVVKNESIAIDPAKRAHLPSVDLDAHVCTGIDGVTAFAFGPFHLSLGDWLNVFGSFKLDTGGVVSYSSDVVHNDMESTVPSSVVHMHHVHIKEPDDRSGHRFETHGDYYGIHGDRYAMALPPGYCTVHDVPEWYAVSKDRSAGSWSNAIGGVLVMDALMNVITSDPTTLSNKPLYFRIAFQTSDVNRCSRVDKMMLMPFMLGLNDPLTRFTIPTPYKIVYWWNGRFPRSGNVVSMWRHSHRQRDGGMLMYANQLVPREPWITSVDPSMDSIEHAIYDAYSVRPIARTRHDDAAQFEWDVNFSVRYGMYYTVVAPFTETHSHKIHKSHTIIFMHYVPSKRQERLQYVDGGDGLVLVDGTVHHASDRRSLMNDASFCCRHWRLQWSNDSSRFEWAVQGSVASGQQNCPVSLDSIRNTCINNDT
jgi:hypothetical protein